MGELTSCLISMLSSVTAHFMCSDDVQDRLIRAVYAYRLSLLAAESVASGCVNSLRFLASSSHPIPPGEYGINLNQQQTNLKTVMTNSASNAHNLIVEMRQITPPAKFCSDPSHQSMTSQREAYPLKSSNSVSLTSSHSSQLSQEMNVPKTKASICTPAYTPSYTQPSHQSQCNQTTQQNPADDKTTDAQAALPPIEVVYPTPRRPSAFIPLSSLSSVHSLGPHQSVQSTPQNQNSESYMFPYHQYHSQHNNHDSISDMQYQQQDTQQELPAFLSLEHALGPPAPSAQYIGSYDEALSSPILSLDNLPIIPFHSHVKHETDDHENMVISNVISLDAAVAAANSAAAAFITGQDEEDTDGGDNDIAMDHNPTRYYFSY